MTDPTAPERDQDEPAESADTPQDRAAPDEPTTEGNGDAAEAESTVEAEAEPEAADDAPSAGDGEAEAEAAPEPAVTRQMPVIDAPPPPAEPEPAPAPAPPPVGPRQPTVYKAPAARAATSSDSWAPPKAPAPVSATPPPPPPGPPGEVTVVSDLTVPPRHLRPEGMPSGEAPAPAAPPAHRDPRQLALLAAPVVVLLLLIVAWAVDSSTKSGQVLRNVDLAGHSISGMKEDKLTRVVADFAKEQAARKVTITATGSAAPSGATGATPLIRPRATPRTLETTAGALGLVVDEKATVDAALDVGRGDSLLVQPFSWLGSFFGTRSVPIKYSVSRSKAASTLEQLQLDVAGTQPVEPKVQLAANGFFVVPGKAGVGIDSARLTKALEKAAKANPEGAIKLKADQRNVDPQFSNKDAQELADRANSLTAAGLSLKADSTTTKVPAQTLRGWITPTLKDGKADLVFDKAGAEKALPALLGGLGKEPKNATVTLQNGHPVVIPSQNGVTCCGANAGDKVWQALQGHKGQVELEAKVQEPEWTTAEVQKWGIKQPIGGNRGWKDNVDIPNGQPPGFTTYHPCCEARVINIETIAKKIRGAVIPPGGDFSINDYVGQRKYSDGYVDAGAIRESRHVSEVGGGISQFSTTTLNAAYFAGLDINEYQSHSEHFSRYPFGREATMGFPHPDLKLHNNTPYGVLIWTDFTPTSLTVTFWSTPYIKAEQTGRVDTMQGVCLNVVTTRTRTWPDGHTKKDQFRSTYRPTGKLCDGTPVAPAPEEGKPHG